MEKDMTITSLEGDVIVEVLKAELSEERLCLAEINASSKEEALEKLDSLLWKASYNMRSLIGGRDLRGDNRFIFSALVWPHMSKRAMVDYFVVYH